MQKKMPQGRSPGGQQVSLGKVELLSIPTASIKQHECRNRHITCIRYQQKRMKSYEHMSMSAKVLWVNVIYLIRPTE